MLERPLAVSKSVNFLTGDREFFLTGDREFESFPSAGQSIPPRNSPAASKLAQSPTCSRFQPAAEADATRAISVVTLLRSQSGFASHNCCRLFLERQLLRPPCGPALFGVDESSRAGVPARSLARYGLAGVSGTTAGTPSGLMLKARKVNGSLPGLPHWWTRPKGS
jgi:hypothetical protein